jgi:hypothetical protein
MEQNIIIGMKYTISTSRPIHAIHAFAIEQDLLRDHWAPSPKQDFGHLDVLQC